MVPARSFRPVVACAPLLAVLCGFQATAVAAQGPATRTVLTIHAGAEFFPSNPLIDQGIRETLASQSDMRIEYFAEYLEDDFFPSEDASLAFSNYLRDKYRDRHIDLVITFTDPVLRFATAHRDELFPDAPIVFGDIQPPDDMARAAGAGMTGIRISVAYLETVRLALRLLPDTERILVVAKSSDARGLALAQSALHDLPPNVPATFIAPDTLADLLRQVRALPPRSIVFYLWYFQGPYVADGFLEDTARRVAEASPVPVFGASDFYVGTGVVGGVVRDTEETGHQLAQLALRVLTGTRAADIPVAPTDLTPYVDWRQIQRWHIDETRIPSNTRIRFREPTVWQQYRWYVIPTVLVLCAQMVLIAALLTNRMKRLRAEKNVRNREAALRTSFGQIRQLNARLINAQEAARSDIARELHDGVCQELVTLSMDVGELKLAGGSLQDPKNQSSLSTLHLSTLRLVDSVRRLSHDLHPATLRLVGLAAAIRGHCTEVEQRHRVTVQFEPKGDFGRVPPDVSLCLFRIAQEALRNAAIHAQAHTLGVSLSRTDTAIELVVRDDGKGLDVDAVRRAGHGIGLISIEERARLVGGVVTIESGPVGTAVHVRVPGTGAASQTQDAAYNVAP